MRFISDLEIPIAMMKTESQGQFILFTTLRKLASVFSQIAVSLESLSTSKRQEVKEEPLAFVVNAAQEDTQDHRRPGDDLPLPHGLGHDGQLLSRAGWKGCRRTLHDPQPPFR